FAACRSRWPRVSVCREARSLLRRGGRENVPVASNHVRFRLSPEVVIALGVRAKRSGEGMIGEDMELMATHQRGDEMQPYERLLGDALHGDSALFAREDALEAQWRIVDPVLGNVTPV